MTYSLGALYDKSQENVILVGLIPGPNEPKRNINTFLRPLALGWCTVCMFTEVVIRCALIPAGRKICGFLSHAARPVLAALSVTKNFQGLFVQWIIQDLTETVGEYVQVMNILILGSEAKICQQNQQWSKQKVCRYSMLRCYYRTLMVPKCWYWTQCITCFLGQPSTS